MKEKEIDIVDPIKDIKAFEYTIISDGYSSEKEPLFDDDTDEEE